MFFVWDMGKNVDIGITIGMLIAEIVISMVVVLSSWDILHALELVLVHLAMIRIDVRIAIQITDQDV
jgi:hypothetical protein